jgi:L-2-hydroxyglutarate oxidase LhgO
MFVYNGARQMKKQVDFDIIIVGGGIVGLASACKIAGAFKGLSIAVLEKEDRLAAHQTSHNSGVIHSGLYYKPGSAKAITCSKGRHELIAFAKEHGIEHEICGKIIVATAEKELPNLERVFNSGLANKIEGLEKIDAEQIKQLEPHCRGIAGLKVPCTGIIDFAQVAEKLAELTEAVSGDNKVMTSQKVIGFDQHDFFTKVVTESNSFTTRYIINCAGLQSDRIAEKFGVHARMKIVPFRGDYYDLTPTGAEKVKNLIYPVPDPTFPFLGVHFTRRIDNTFECGPNAVFAFKREGYSKTAFSMADTWDSLTYPALWKMFLRNMRYGLGEYARAFSKKLFLRSLQRLIPDLQDDEITPGNAGIRAQALASNGRLIDDFAIETMRNSIHVLNAPSPAATACLAIGEDIKDLAKNYFNLE